MNSQIKRDIPSTVFSGDLWSFPSPFPCLLLHLHKWQSVSARFVLSVPDRPLGSTVHQRVIDKVIARVCLREPGVTGAFYISVFWVRPDEACVWLLYAACINKPVYRQHFSHTLMSSNMFSVFVSLLASLSLCWYGIFMAVIFSFFPSPVTHVQRGLWKGYAAVWCENKWVRGYAALLKRRHSRVRVCVCGMRLPSGLMVWVEKRDRRPCTKDRVGGLSVSLALCLSLYTWFLCFTLSMYLPASAVIMNIICSRLWQHPNKCS